MHKNAELVLNYRKHHLYFLDINYFKEGDGFVNFEMLFVKNNKKITLNAMCAICMDVCPNCYKYK